MRAFCQEFKGSEDVRLIVKTFPNPHNDIEAILREMDAEYPRHAAIELISTPLDHGRMRYLYEHAGCLVSPSRGEGFGLPVAEAMLLGCPVIATIYSGQADICQAEHCWPVDYKLEPARTHLTEGKSFWAEPSLDSLRQQMRSVYNASAQERAEKTGRARRSWRNASPGKGGRTPLGLLPGGARSGKTNRYSGCRPRRRRRSIGFVTTWNTKCGIAEYTRYLATNLPMGIGLPSSPTGPGRNWSDRMSRT